MAHKVVCICLVLAFALPPAVWPGEPASVSLWPLLATLQSKRFVDLSHSFHPHIPYSPSTRHRIFHSAGG